MSKLLNSDKDGELPISKDTVALASSNGFGGGYDAESGDGDEVQLRDYWRVVHKHLWLVILITIVGVAPIVYLSGMKANYYQAVSRVQVNLENSNAVNGGEANGSAGVFLSADPAYFNTQLQMLNSPALLRRVSETLDLEHNAIFLKHMAKGGRILRKALRLFYLGKSDPAQPIDDSQTLTKELSPSVSAQELEEAQRLRPIVDDLQKKLKVEPVKETRLAFKETRLIDITCEHPNPQLAAKIANAIADGFVLANLEQRRRVGQTSDEFLNNRIQELQIKIRNGETELIEYAKNHQILSLDANQNTVVDRLTGLNRQLLEAENDRILAEANYRKALDPGALQALSSETAREVDGAESRLSVLRESRAQMLVGATEKWPEVKEINQQISELEKNIKHLKDDAANTLKTNLETRYRQALEHENVLRDAFNKQRGETLQQNEAAINYRIKQQEIDTNKVLLQGILQREKENDVAVRGSTNNVSVVDYAITPDPKEPAGPWRLLWISIALALSLSAGVGMAFLLEHLDNSVRSREDVLTQLQLPTLGIIPVVKKSFRDRLIHTNGNGHGSPAILANASSPLPFSEEYKRLRTAVTLTGNGRSSKSILVTSSNKGEGKTTTALNIATTMAQTEGASILIIDADLHKPRLQNILGLPGEHGLASILTGDVAYDKVDQLILKHESGVYLLPSGPLPVNSAELLSSNVLRQLLTHLEQSFTHIIIDSPAADEFADSLVISTIVDGVLFVVHGTKSSRNSVRYTLQDLRSVGANLLGVVLNGMKNGRQQYSYYN